MRRGRKLGPSKKCIYDGDGHTTVECTVEDEGVKVIHDRKDYLIRKPDGRVQIVSGTELNPK